ncbi:MAG: amidohydrolase family protein [Candidatus Limnocylindrales bacterium]
MMRTVFTGGRLFDGTARLKAADVAVEDGWIKEIGPGLDGDASIDLDGRAVLPGMFDCHTHVIFDGVDLLRELETPFSYWFYLAIGNLRRTLAIGITTVRDASGADMGVKKAVADGLVAGPRVHIAISPISQTGGHGDGWLLSGIDITPPAYPGFPAGVVDGPDEMRRRVRELVRAGADHIKVFTSGGVLSPRDDPRHGHFRDDELDVLVAEANAAGIHVMSHAQGAPGIKAAVRAGIRSVEHGIFLDDEAISMMLEAGTWLVPTLMAPQGVLDAADAGASIPATSVRKAREVIDVHRESVGRAIAAGVKVAMGTDSGVMPHGRNLRELQLMVDAGMTPLDAMLATTRNAAELMRVDAELGTLEPGKRADLVAVDGDPFDYTDLGDRVRAVWQDGRLVSGGLG